MPPTAERDLAARARELSIVLDFVGAVALRWLPDGTLEYLSELGAHYFGEDWVTHCEASARRNVFDGLFRLPVRVPEREREAAVRALFAGTSTEVSATLDLDVKCRALGLHWAHHPLHAPDGTLQAVFSVARGTSPQVDLAVPRAPHQEVAMPSEATAAPMSRRSAAVRALLDNLPFMAWLKDRDGRFLAVNAVYARISGKDRPEDVVGLTDFDLWPTPHAELYRADDEEVMGTGRQKILEELARSGDETLILETYKSPIFDQEGRVIGTTGICRDVTAEKRAHERLSQSQSRLANIFDFAPGALALTRPSGEVLAANQACCDLLKRPREEIVGSYVQRLGIWTDEAARARFVEVLLREGRIDHAAVTVLDSRGEVIHLELSGVKLDDGGEQLLLLGALDVTARRRAEEALRDSEQRFRLLADCSRDVIWRMDAQGRFTYLSPSVEALRGYTVEEVMQQSMQDFLTPESLAVAQRLWEQNAQLMAAGLPLPEHPPIELEQYRRDGSTVWVEALMNVVRGPNGEFLGVQGVSRDITERREAEAEQLRLQQQVMQAQKLESLGILAGGIAHDFNNLLTSILGNADLARLTLDTDCPAHENLEDIASASRHAADLCRQMLAYSGKGRFVTAPVDLSALVKDLGQLLSVSISKKAVLRYELAAALPPLTGDASQLRQLVMNLITNASEALEDQSGSILVATRLVTCEDAAFQGALGTERLPPGDYVSLEVTDTGVGMTPEVLQRIFDPFFTTKFTGRGLGLAAVLGIVRGHGGALQVASEPGRGTTFRVLLPPGDRPRSHAAVPPATRSEWRGAGAVLLIDDEEAVRRIGARILEHLGFEAILASDGLLGLQTFTGRRREIRAVLVDLTMPVMDGAECVSRLRELDATVPIVLCSGYDAKGAAERFREQGLAGFIQKPFTAEDLRRTLEGLLPRR